MKTKNQAFVFFLLLLIWITYAQCISIEKAKQQNLNNEVFGFSFLEKIPGLWNGALSSTTSSGNFDNWYVDFRPVSASQISQYSMVDSNTVNNISFFIVKHNHRLKVAMRTEGCFQEKCCITYEVMDSVNEDLAYYRFSDFISGEKRAFTEFRFNKDALTMDVYTNKFNKSKTTLIHTHWDAKLGDRKVAKEAEAYFNFPQPIIVKDFSDAFKNMNESIFFTFDNDPYPTKEQPYVGSVTVNISVDKTLKVKKQNELFILFTSESLFDGLKYIKDSNKYYSKYIFLPFGTTTYTFKNVHPGKYYVYSFDDINNDRKHLKGDYMSSNLNNIINVPENGNVKVETVIDFVIP